MGRSVDSQAMQVVVSIQLHDYLTLLSKEGIQGKSPSEVARFIIQQQISQLRKDGYFDEMKGELAALAAAREGAPPKPKSKKSTAKKP